MNITKNLNKILLIESILSGILGGVTKGACSEYYEPLSGNLQIDSLSLNYKIQLEKSFKLSTILKVFFSLSPQDSSETSYNIQNESWLNNETYRNLFLSKFAEEIHRLKGKLPGIIYLKELSHQMERSEIDDLINQTVKYIRDFRDNWKIKMNAMTPVDFDESKIKKSVKLIDPNGIVTTFINRPLKIKLSPRFLELNNGKQCSNSNKSEPQQKFININMKINDLENSLINIKQYFSEQTPIEIFISNEQLQSLDHINEFLSMVEDKILYEFSKRRNDKLLHSTSYSEDIDYDEQIKSFFRVIKDFSIHINNFLTCMKEIGGKFYDLETAVSTTDVLLKKIESYLD